MQRDDALLQPDAAAQHLHLRHGGCAAASAVEGRAGRQGRARHAHACHPRRFRGRRRQVPRQARQPLQLQPHVGAARPDVHPVDQETDDPRLLCGEELLPQRVEPLQCQARLVLRHVRRRDARRAPGPEYHLRLAQQPPDLGDDSALDLRRGNARDGRPVRGAALQHRLAHVVAILLAAAPPRMGGRHGAPVAAEDQPAQQRRRLAAGAVGACPRADRQQGVRRVPHRLGHDGGMLAGVRFPLVHRLAEIGPVAQHSIHIALGEGAAALRSRALGAEGLHQLRAGFRLDEAIEDASHQRGFGVVHQQLAIVRIVAERHEAAHPDPARP